MTLVFGFWSWVFGLRSLEPGHLFQRLSVIKDQRPKTKDVRPKPQMISIEDIYACLRLELCQNHHRFKMFSGPAQFVLSSRKTV